MWLNNIHANQPSSPGGFGGAVCSCAECTKARCKPLEISALEILQEANGIKEATDATLSARRAG